MNLSTHYKIIRCTALAVMLCGLLFFNHAAAEVAAPPGDIYSAMRESSCGMGEVETCLPGRWGTVEYTATMISPPSFITGDDPNTHISNAWVFVGFQPDELERRLHKAGLDDQSIARLMMARVPGDDDLHIKIIPPVDILVDMSPDVRYRVYALLAASKSSNNKFYLYPFGINRQFTHEWFRGASLSGGTRSLVDRLVYPHRNMVYFSDVRFVLSQIETAEERLDFFAALIRQVTLIARLKIHDSGEIEQLVAYWGVHGRANEVRPLIEALSRGNLDWPVDLVLLLPSFPRGKLMTYDTGKNGTFHDCGWTALNFFNHEPDDRYLDPEVQNHVLLNEYVSVPDQFQFGDVILFRNDEGRIIHICNYIADHIVFTKNGGNTGQPWIFSTLGDVIDYYTLGDDTPEILFVRKR